MCEGRGCYYFGDMPLSQSRLRLVIEKKFGLGVKLEAHAGLYVLVILKPN